MRTIARPIAPTAPAVHGRRLWLMLVIVLGLCAVLSVLRLGGTVASSAAVQLPMRSAAVQLSTPSAAVPIPIPAPARRPIQLAAPVQPASSAALADLDTSPESSSAAQDDGGDTVCVRATGLPDLQVVAARLGQRQVLVHTLVRYASLPLRAPPQASL